MTKEGQNSKTYISRLKKLSKQAESEKKYFVCDFIQKMINTYSFDVEKYDYIYKTADDLTAELVKAYEFLFDAQATLEWFQCMGKINDERNCPEEYFQVVQESWKADIPIEKVQGALDASESSKEFKELTIFAEKKTIAKEDDMSRNYVDFLLKENEEKSARINLLLEENCTIRREMKNLQENSFKYRFEVQQGKQELERIRKENAREIFTGKLLVKKVGSLQGINSELEKRNEALQQTEKRLHEELEQVRRIVTEYEQAINERDEKIELLSKSLEGHMLFNDESPLNKYGEENFSYKQEYDSLRVEIPGDNDLEEYTVGNNIFENILSIEDKTESIVKSTNLFTTILSKYYKKRFEKKEITEQENLIFIKMMEYNFSKEMVLIVKNAMRTNTSISRVELYMLISKKVTREELLEFCEAVA